MQTVQRFFGVSVAYQANGSPAVAYLGGPPDFTAAFWYQNDAAVSYYQGGRWVEQVAATDSSPPVSGSAPSDNGNIVGFYPALLFQGNNAVLAYRDGHFGSSAGTGDWNAADLEMAIGGPTTWAPVALLEAGNAKGAGKGGYGAHNRIIVGAQTLSSGLRGAAVVSDRAGTAPDTFGADIEFSEQQPDGTWKSCGALQPLTSVDTPSILGSNGATILPNTQSGPSIDYRDNFGYAVAVTDRSQNGALFTSCAANSDCLQPGSGTRWTRCSSAEPAAGTRRRPSRPTAIPRWPTTSAPRTPAATSKAVPRTTTWRWPTAASVRSGAITRWWWITARCSRPGWSSSAIAG